MNIETTSVNGFTYWHDSSSHRQLDVMEKIASLLETAGFNDSDAGRYYDPHVYKVTIVVEEQ